MKKYSDITKSFRRDKLTTKAIGELAEKINKELDLLIKPEDLVKFQIIKASYHKKFSLKEEIGQIESHPSEFYKIIKNNGKLDSEIWLKGDFSPEYLGDISGDKIAGNNIERIYIKIVEHKPFKNSSYSKYDFLYEDEVDEPVFEFEKEFDEEYIK